MLIEKRVMDFIAIELFIEIILCIGLSLRIPLQHMIIFIYAGDIEEASVPFFWIWTAAVISSCFQIQMVCRRFEENLLYPVITMIQGGGV